MKPSLVPLQCEACGGRVPLAPGDATPCPSCGANVEIPAAYRELRDTERQLDATRQQAHRIAIALARVPPWPVRMLAMFDHWAFLGFGLAFWIVAGVTVGVLLPPLFGAPFGVSTIDVLDDNTQAWIGFVVPIGTFALGLLGAGWARKRVIGRGSLQAALAARPPERAGGPAGCRQCGAALQVGRGAHAITCPYCDTENIVDMPPSFLAKVKQQKVSLGREVDEAIALWKEIRRELRWSLVLRGIVGVSIVGVPSTCLIDPAPQRGTTTIEYAAGSPGRLPSWRTAREGYALPPVGFCKPATVSIVGFTTRAEDCTPKGCAYHRLVPLQQGESLRIVGGELPGRVEVALQIHERTFLDDRWTEVARGVVGEEPVVLRPTLSAWYRLAYDVPGVGAGTIVRACVELG